MSTRFSPGNHKLLVWDQGLGLLDAAVTDQQAEVVWREMLNQTDLGAFLQILMESTGEGLLTIPAFAVAIRTSRGMHVAVRGRFQLSVTTADEVVSLAGENVTTWEEKLLAEVVSVELRADRDGGRRLPMVVGIAEADWVGWSSTDQQEPQPPAADVAAEPIEVIPVVKSELPTVHPETQPRHGEADALATLAPESTEPEDKAEVVEDSLDEIPGGGVYAYLFSDDTSAPDLEAAAIREPEAVEEEAEPEPNPMHDGLTVLGEEDEELPIAPTAETDQQVLAANCERGHPNPPQRGECYVCQAAVVGEPAMMPRPQLGWLHISGGERVPLRGPVVAGRNPKSIAIATSESPRLVALPHRHVSSNHLAFVLEGWTVLVRDLGSSNGSYLRRHNKPPVRLPEHDTPLIPGDVIDLGHGVFISLDRTP